MRWRCARSAASSSAGSSPRAWASDCERVDDVCRLVPLTAHRLRREVGAVGLGEDSLRRHLRCGEAKVDGLRIGRVAGEGDVPAALERGREHVRRREAVEDDGAGVSRRARRACPRRRRACGSRPACLARPPSRAALRRAAAGRRAARSRGTSRARSPHRDCLGCATSSRNAAPSPRCRAGLVRMDAEDREDPVVPLRELERAAAVVHARADREDPRDARFGGAQDRLVGVLERGEVRMRVDHGSSAARTASASSLRKSGRGSRSVWPGGSSLGAHEPTQLA